jgi:tripartite-type tricarboxylate transporter receptor subunit TctC
MHRHACLALTALILSAAPVLAELPAGCQAALQGQPLSIIVPNGPGGGYDTYARAMAPRFEALFGLRARVENLPAAGGLAAYRRLIEAPPEDWTVLLEEADDLIRGMADAALGPDGASRYRIAAVFHAEPSTWVTRPGFDPLNPPGGVLAVGSSSNDDRDELLAVSNALGLPARLISGYDGSSAMGLAVQAGEVDLISVSLGSALRLSRSGDLAPAMVLSNGAWPSAPDLPFLFGPGGRIEARLATLPPADAERSRQLAGYAVDLALVLRSVAVPTSLPADRAACLDAAVAALLVDPGFHDAAAAEGRPVVQLPPDEAKAAVSRLMHTIETFATLAPTLTQIE